MKVFTKDALKSVNHMAELLGYHRVTRPEFLEALPDDKFYIPKYELLHKHRAGERCEPHMRCVFEHDGAMFMIDVELGCYNLVPDHATVLATIRGEQLQEAAAAE